MSAASLFNLPEGHYFLSHSVGCLPKKAETSLAENFLTPWKMSGGDAWPIWLDTIDAFCASLGKLLHGQEPDFCPQSNLSSGFTKWLMSLPETQSIKTATKRKILIHQTAFPSMGFVCNAMQKMGFELVFIPASEPVSNKETWEQAINKDVFCVLATHVHSNTGAVAPIEHIAMLCEKYNSYFAVDIAQSAGILPINLTSWNADAVFGSCVKWLCGGPGAGFMWVNPQTTEMLSPIDVGWFSHQNPFEMDINHFQYAQGAKRFWGGTPNVAPFALARGSVETLLEIGQQNIFAHNRRLANELLINIEDCLQASIDLENNGGTLCIELPDANINMLESELQRQHCYFDVRGNVMRFSFHIYNTLPQIELLIEAIRTSVKR